MLDYRNADSTGNAQRSPHDRILENRLTIIGHSDCSRLTQFAEVRQLLAFAPTRGCSDGKNVNDGATIRMLHPASDLHRVVHWRSVGHGANRGKTASCRRGSAGGDGLFVLLAGFAQVNVDVDKSG